jgi:hypothetical protein
MPQEARGGQGTGLGSAEPFDSVSLGWILLDCADRKASEVLSRTRSGSASILGTVLVGSRFTGQITSSQRTCEGERKEEWEQPQRA